VNYFNFTCATSSCIMLVNWVPTCHKG